MRYTKGLSFLVHGWNERGKPAITEQEQKMIEQSGCHAECPAQGFFTCGVLACTL